MCNNQIMNANLDPPSSNLSNSSGHDAADNCLAVVACTYVEGMPCNLTCQLHQTSLEQDGTLSRCVCH